MTPTDFQLLPPRELTPQPNSQRARNRFQEAQAHQGTPAAGGGVLPVEHEYKLLPSLLAHAHYPSEADYDLDDEEWVRVREEVIRLACLQSYW